MKKNKRLVKPIKGPSPRLLGKGHAHQVRVKYTRKRKHSNDYD